MPESDHGADPRQWRKSSASNGGADPQCVEVCPEGFLRNSKNPSGPVLRVSLGPFLAALKRGDYVGLVSRPSACGRSAPTGGGHNDGLSG